LRQIQLFVQSRRNYEWYSSLVMTSKLQEGIMTKRKACALAGLVVALLAAPAVSHHSFAVFDQSKLLSLTGTVKEFELVNPHAWLHLNIVDEKGDVSTWSFEAGSPAQLIKLGWSKDTFQVGGKVAVGFRPLKDGSRGGQLMNVKLPGGQKLCSNRGCGDGTGVILPPE